MNKQLLFTLLLTGMVTTLLSLQTTDTTLPIFQDEEEVAVTKEAQPEVKTEPVSSYAKAPADVTEVVKNVIESTCAIIKPDAVDAGFSGKIIELIELNRFEIVNMQKKTLTHKEAESFYAIHKEKPFFNELVAFMTSGPVIVLELKKLNAIRDWRYLMGATNPERAHMGTLRAMFGADITHNATHGSDSKENAAQEVAFFFAKPAPVVEPAAEATEIVEAEEVA